MDQPFFTVSACNRCRRRKSRCDARLPHCLPCQNAGTRCEYTEVRTKTTYSREYICHLEVELEKLETELQALTIQFSSVEDKHLDENGHGSPISRQTGNQPQPRAQADLIRLEIGGDAHYLGISSGMHLARSVLESAQRDNPSFDSISQCRSIDFAPYQGDDRNLKRDHRSPLPSMEVAADLIDIFFSQHQVQYPILLNDHFCRETERFYNRGAVDKPTYSDITHKFMLQIVFSISLLALSKEHPEALMLAENFYASAMAELPAIMPVKQPRTLQCLLLLLLYSLMNSSDAPVWYISGICMRMCVDLGLHSRRTIRLSGTGQASEDDMDTKRRLFWVTYSFDRTLSIILGRPFTLDEKQIDIEYPDKTLPEDKRTQIIHWFELQRLQSDAVLHLYTAKVPQVGREPGDNAPISDWMRGMSQRLATWNEKVPYLADSHVCALDWWRYWHQNALLMLHLPSPKNPSLDTQSYLTCYAAAKNMIQLSFIRAHRGDMGPASFITWVDVHYQFIAGITLLFLIWNSSEVRERAKSEWSSFKSCLVQWDLVLEGMVDRWDQVKRAKEVLLRLADATVEAVDRDLNQNGDILLRTGTRTRDRDHRKSIMQRLRSPDTTTNNATRSLSRSWASTSQLADPPGVADHTTPFSYPGASKTDTINLSGDVFCADTDISGASGSPTTALEIDERSGFPFWPLAQQSFDGVFSTIHPNLSGMLNEEMWSAIRSYGNTGSDTSWLEYLPTAMQGDALGTNVERSTRTLNWAESVLNFQGS